MDWTEPKIYTGGVDVQNWDEVTEKERALALSKAWYIRWTYRNPKTGLIERQTNIKAGANRFTNKEDRLKVLNAYRRELKDLLQSGYSPYNHPTTDQTLGQSIDAALDVKRSQMSVNSFKRYRPRIDAFKDYVSHKGLLDRPCSVITKKIVVEYLNEINEKTSSSNRNNARSDLSALFSVLEDLEMIPANIVKGIPILKTRPVKNKTFSEKELEQVLKNCDPQLRTFIGFVSYNFLRPIEVCRLTVGSINFESRTLSIRTKEENRKVKIIPEALSVEAFKGLPLEYSLFTPEGGPGLWSSANDNKRDYFSKRFKKVKDKLGLGSEYGIYSFRHTYITKLYRAIRADGKTPFEAKSEVMLITGHSSMQALEKYLRDIDAELPEDYTKYLQ